MSHFIIEFCFNGSHFKRTEDTHLAVDWAGFFPGWANFLSQKIGPGWAWAILHSKKLAQAKMGQVKSGLGQNGPVFLVVIVPKWAYFVSF